MNLNKPQPFTPKKNQIGKDWRIWKKGFLIYLKLSGGYENCTEEERAAFLLNIMGSEAVKTIENISFDHPSERNDMGILIMKFDEIFDPPPNEILERYKFFSRTKGAKEGIENYVAVLKEKAVKCNFGSQTEKLIIDMVIRNMNKEYQEKMFEIGDIILPDIIQHYKNYVINTEQMEELSTNIMKTFSSTNSIAGANMNKVKQKRSKNCSRSGVQHVRPFKPCSANSKTHKNEEWKSRPFCSKCETNHPFKQCPAYNGTNKNEEVKTQPICLKCGSNHPFEQCPTYNKTGISEGGKAKPICLKCGTNHPFKQCPAFDEIDLTYDTKGHLASKCKQKETIKQASVGNNNSEKKSEASNSTNKQNVEHKSVVNKLEDCEWCGSRHALLGKCLHDANCRTCYKFPHNICFKCRKNPHISNCYYKAKIALPQVVVSSLNNRLKPDTTTCIRCGTKHGAAAECPDSKKERCKRFNNFGHLTGKCPLDKNLPNRQNVNPEANTVDSLSQGFGAVRNKDNPNVTYFDRASDSTNKQDVEHKSLVNELEDCEWCGSRHALLGKCLHDANCITCQKFPHNICFKCRKNPHDNNCRYKARIALSKVVPSLNTRLKLDTPTCFRCGTKHDVVAVCPDPRKDRCKRCYNFGHLTEKCPLHKNWSNRQYGNPIANTVDSLSPGFGSVRNGYNPNATYSDKASDSTNKQDGEHKYVVNELEDCQWCGSRHGLLGKCLHDANCVTCQKFPHNICFKCRKNPHEINCRYYSRITLPQVVLPLNTRFKLDRRSTCFRCGTKHVAAVCPICLMRKEL